MLAFRFRRPIGRRPWVFAHRGARFAAPENTLRAFEAARGQGADGIEFDVRADADLRPIVFHDDRLLRMTSGADRRSIEMLTESELVRVRVQGEKIPTLFEVLDWAKGNDLLLNIEVKHDILRRTALLGQLVDVLKLEPDLWDRCLLSCFHPQVILRLKMQLPHLAVAWLIHNDQRWLCYLPTVTAFGANAVHPEYRLLSERLVRLYRRRGFWVNTWTVNSRSDARRACRLGVDGVITDVPAHIISALEK